MGTDGHGWRIVCHETHETHENRRYQTAKIPAGMIRYSRRFASLRGKTEIFGFRFVRWVLRFRVRATERWQSGRSRLTRNQVMAYTHPGVRIPPSPPFSPYHELRDTGLKLRNSLRGINEWESRFNGDEISSRFGFAANGQKPSRNLRISSAVKILRVNFPRFLR
jgi:hypothetical protein